MEAAPGKIERMGVLLKTCYDGIDSVLNDQSNFIDLLIDKMEKLNEVLFRWFIVFKCVFYLL